MSIPGEGQRVVVEVLNATGVEGMARAMTLRLRRAGIDVVYYGSARTRDLDSTLILVRRGDSSVAALIREALGGGRVIMDTAARLLLDASVLLGHDLTSSGRVDP